MGIGDELMMAGEARRLKAAGARKVGMLDKYGVRRWHYVWEGNPSIARPAEDCDALVGYVNGRRAYLVDESPTHRTFRAYAPEPAELALPASARALMRETAGAVVFNPAIKTKAPPNKAWGIERWEQLIRLMPEVRWVQIGEPHGRQLFNVRHIPTSQFLDGCGLLAGARAAVLHEGALHHAAAALKVPAIVIRGGYISPRVTGYAGQVDFYVEDERYPLGCGARVRCEHCSAAMASITPAAVAQALRELLKKAA